MNVLFDDMEKIIDYISRLSDEDLIYISYVVEKEIAKRISSERREKPLSCVELSNKRVFEPLQVN